MIKRLVFALLAALLICILIMVFASMTKDSVRDMEATQTQNVIEATWDAELHSAP